ncbi:rhamnogalacturonan acetylesterase [Pelagicoccus albus]|uniref:Rhamnogalacturonan acetylesterase n=1 Tax=Pelagicoccus albus TaxID=415222 RepID=A0A7X1B849_9BACT|nr:rhamnogalacturonan acetylesterase [Pelagicoccus albus]MBC2607454.1 rhamnogalacturonan acetylesterase [Pelagicoccus albus]
MRYLKPLLAALTAFLLCSCETTSLPQEVEPLTIVLIGDSTMAKKRDTARPEMGWGEALEAFFDGSVSVSNHALNGRSSKSFIGEGHWEKALAELQEGDVLVVEFGHNDQKIKSPDRYTEPYGEYSDNLRRYAQEAQERGASVIIASSICRRKFNEAGVLEDTHGDYPAAAEAVAEELGLPYVDMEARSREMLIALGPQASEGLFMNLKPEEFENYPDGKEDNTHLQPQGAKAHAQLFVDGLLDLGHPLTERLR